MSIDQGLTDYPRVKQWAIPILYALWGIVRLADEIVIRSIQTIHPLTELHIGTMCAIGSSHAIGVANGLDSFVLAILRNIRRVQFICLTIYPRNHS